MYQDEQTIRREILRAVSYLGTPSGPQVSGHLWSSCRIDGNRQSVTVIVDIELCKMVDEGILDEFDPDEGAERPCYKVSDLLTFIAIAID